MNHLILGQEYTILVEITLKKLKTSQKNCQKLFEKTLNDPRKVYHFELVRVETPPPRQVMIKKIYI